jgi:NRAMP (natural resistance-associated macrophage protein)-like metal ion transporter
MTRMSQSAPRPNRNAGTTLPLASPPPAASSPPPEPFSAPRRRPLWLVLLSVFGPGVIAAAAGNDAGGIATYSQAGAKYGLTLLWSIAVVTVGLIVVQEMCARMGAVTGKGLAALIRENFGVKVTAFAMLVLLIANFATTVSEFAGIAAVGELFHIPRYYTVPFAIVLVWLLVSRGSYQKVERILLIASLVFVTYIITALRIGVTWAAVAKNTFTPALAHLHWGDSGLILMVVSLIGTTIAPYMQFYQQSAVRDKGVTMRDYSLTRWDTIIGCVLSNVVAAFIIVACYGTLYLHGVRNISDAKDAALALVPIAGKFVAYGLFAFGLLNASLMAAVIVPLSTAYAVTESLGWESGMGRRIRELPLFYGTYGFMILLSGLVILLSSANLISIIIEAQVVNCALLPLELILMLILINRRRVMGKYRNTLWDNIVAWATTVVAGGLALYYFAQQIWSLVHPS